VTGPLDGVTGLLDGMRVLDAGIWRPVPHATQMLADLGAQVLKIEPPGGDPMRAFPQLFRDIAGHKRSIELNLRTAEGRARALELVAGADVFCEGWRPGVAARLGLGYDAVRAVNPSIVYCSVSGYGQTGPNVERPGHDVNYQALAGALAPRAGETPAIPRVPIADLAAGTVAAFCICAAWARRLRTGEGERIDVAMADVVASWSGTSSGNVLRGRTEPTRGSAGYGVFACADGGWITLAVISEDHFWHAVCDALDLPGDLRALGHLARLDRFEDCQEAVANACARLTRAAALDRLTRAGAPVAPVLDPAEMAADEQFASRKVVYDAGDGTARLGFPARLEQHPPRAPGATPAVDGHRDGWE
jgi:crotonobetainyl-CoA:carnitine CoA-transferase CaiB-like acyl-CoA transferase